MGLDDFKTESKSKSSKSEDEEEEEPKPPWIHDFTAKEWNTMSTSECVEYIRDNYVEDYYPSHQEDDRWSWRIVVEITCVCGNDFVIANEGICLDCGARYRKAGRTVRKTREPYKDGKFQKPDEQ